MKLIIYYFFKSIIRGIAYNTQDESPRAREAVWVINEVINEFILEDRKSITKCKKLTEDFLSVNNGQAKGQHQITAIGNCHIGNNIYIMYLQELIFVIVDK